MTSPNIHPIIQEKLRRFSRQRRRLILWRGLCSTVACWFGAMMALALADRFILLPDALRLALSIVGDLLTAAVFWFECGGSLVHRPDERELARLMEFAAPQLREELLSAVELAESSEQPHFDSDEFRAALQQAAARDVNALPIEGLLSQRLIAKWMYAALAVVALMLALLVTPGLQFNHSLTRAVLPLANLAHDSSVQIKVLAPAPPDQIEPEGDSVAVTVALSGGDADQVVLETIPQRGPRERTLMSLSAVNQFTAAVPLNQDPVRFRIRAGNTLTRFFTLTPKPRPHVVRFLKTYHYPAYSQLPAKSVSEENGDLEALEGTVAELAIEVDQPIKKSSLQIDSSNGKTEKQEILLEHGPNGHLVAHVPLTVSGTYQVRLTSAQTGFENKFSPLYEMRVHPDLIPSVKIDQPEKDQLILPPDSVVNLAGTANDDLAVAAVVQKFQVNQGPWQTVPLVQTNSPEVKVARKWDLFELELHPGDRVITRLVAIDLKGQQGESAPLRIRIGSVGFDPDRLKDLKASQSLDKTIHEFREATDQLEIKTRDARAVINSPTADLLQKKQALLTANSAAETVGLKADDVLQQIKDDLPHAASARDSGDLALIGNAVSRVRHESLPATESALERATEHINAGDDKAAPADVEKILDPLTAAAGLARGADDTHRQLLAAAEANAAANDLQQLAEDQRALKSQAAATETNQIERAAHREAVAADQVKAIEEQLETLSGHSSLVPASMAVNLARNRENLENAITNAPTLDKITAPADRLDQNVEADAANLHNTEREISQRADSFRKSLQDQTGTAADAIARLAGQLQHPDTNAPAGESWQAAAEQLKDRAALEERRPHADAPFAAVVGRTADALQALQDAVGSTPPSTNALAGVKAIEEDLRKVQTGHAIDEQTSALHQLAAKELWEKPSTPSEIADRANEWRAAEQQLQSLPAQMERAQLPADARRAAEAAEHGSNAQQVSDEMNQRAANPAFVHPVGEPLAQLASDIAQVKQQLNPALDQARTDLEKRAPSTSDRLAGLADAAGKLSADTSTAAQQADKPESTNQVGAAAQALAASQQHLDARLSEIKDSIRRDANAQNLATDEGRERARDADDAAALLRQPTPGANDLLQHAAADSQTDQQKSDLKAAADQQAKLATDLKLLADHYQNTDAGHPEATRAALREQETALGLKPTLDAEYAKAQALEKLAGLTPQQQLAELENVLPASQPMRRELSDIAKNMLQSAASGLEQSAAHEQQIAHDIGTPAEQARRIADVAQKMADNTIPAMAQKAGPVVAPARPDLTNAVQQLQSVTQAITNQPDRLGETMQNQIAPLQQAEADLNAAAAKFGQEAAEARQQAQAATQELQQDKATKAGDAAIKQAQTAQQQAQAAAQQAQTAQQQAQEAGQQADQLAQQAAQLAAGLNPATPSNPDREAALNQARQIAAEAQELARQDLPAIAAKAGEPVKPELNQAGQQLGTVARTIPEDLAKSPSQAAQAMEGQAAQVRQAADELNTAAAKLGPAADTAQQEANAAKQSVEQAKATNAGQSAIKQAEAKEQQAEAAAQQARDIQQQTQEAAQRAGQLAQAASNVADTLATQQAPTHPAAIDQARQIAAEAQQLAQQDIPAAAEKAGVTVQPDLTQAGQKLDEVAQSIPQDLAKPPEQLAQTLQRQAAPLQQAARSLDEAANKIGESVVAAQQDQKAAAQEIVEAKAKNAGDEAVRNAEAREQKAEAAVQQTQAAQQQTHAAAVKAAQLAAQANQAAAQQTASALNAAHPMPPVPATPEAMVEQARQIANNTQRLAEKGIPAVSQQAGRPGAPAKSALDNAGQKLATVAQNLPQDFTKPPEQLARAMENQVAPLQQAAADLKTAAAKLGQAANTAQQQAAEAAQQVQQAKSANAGNLAVQKAEAARQQAETAVQQTQAAQQQAQQAAQQTGELARQTGQLADAMNQARPLLQASAQQPAIAEAVHQAADDMIRAGRHEARLGQESTGQQLQQLGKQVDSQTGAQIAQAAASMQRATSPVQIQPAAQAAHDAVAAPLNQLNSAMQQTIPAAANPASPETPGQLAAAPEESAKWLARALDSLDAALHPTPAAGSANNQSTTPGQPHPGDAAQQGESNHPDEGNHSGESGQSGQAAPDAASFAATAAAQAEAASMGAARSQGLVPGEQMPAQPGSSGGGANTGTSANGAPLPDVSSLNGNWGKLPPKLARDLMDSQHEGVSAEFREMVDQYFRAIADKTREKQAP